MRRMITNEQINALNKLSQKQPLLDKMSLSGSAIYMDVDALGLGDQEDVAPVLNYWHDDDEDESGVEFSNTATSGYLHFYLSDNGEASRTELYDTNDIIIEAGDAGNITFKAFGEQMATFVHDGEGSGFVGLAANGVWVGMDTINEVPVVGGSDGELVLSNNQSIESASAYIDLTNDGILFHGLPTSDPGVEGALWNDNGVLKISAGS